MGSQEWPVATRWKDGVLGCGSLPVDVWFESYLLSVFVTVSFLFFEAAGSGVAVGLALSSTACGVEPLGTSVVGA